MIQFTEQEIRHLREKYLKQRSAVNRIIEDVKEIMAEQFWFPKQGSQLDPLLLLPGLFCAADV